MNAVEVKNASKTISNGMNDKRKILNNVSLTIAPGEFVTVLGEMVQERVHYLTAFPAACNWIAALFR